MNALPMMTQLYDKEYHPVLEDFIVEYSDDTMTSVEREAFEEVLVYDDDLRELAHSAKEGRKLLQELATMVSKTGFEERLFKRINSSN